MKIIFAVLLFSELEKDLDLSESDENENESGKGKHLLKKSYVPFHLKNHLILSYSMKIFEFERV